ncbi:unnamed protein product [Rotaria sordida]|uniref:Uncharacterized protein n=1 Tax=Rotaria sordida TaxID=392033 RepID=A0A814DKL1_9BILA|nr:unnamed protein product [Rotaria sordida]
MTLTNIREDSSKLTNGFSMIDNLNNKDEDRKLKRMNLSIFNLFSSNRQTNILKRKNKNMKIEKDKSFLYPQSILTKSELSKSISNRSITFASVFDQLEYDYINKDNHSSFDVRTSINNEDLVIVLPNKYVDNEENKNREAYPFRSEISSNSLRIFNKSSNTVNKSDSRKKFLHRLIHHHQPKKVHRPVQTIQLIDRNYRSISAPNLLFSLSSNPTTTTTTTTTNDHYQSLKRFRQWIKSSSFGQFVQSFIKNRNPSIKKDFKEKSSLKSRISKKSSDLIY